MATRRFNNLATTIRRYGPSSVHPEVNPSVDLGDGGAKAFQAIAKLAQNVAAFIRPAYEEEQTTLGMNEAIDDVRTGRFKYRAPYTIRSQAYNDTAKRVTGARARTEYAARVGDVISGATSEAELVAGLNGLVDEVTGSLPSEFAEVRRGLEEQSQAMFAMARSRFRDAAPVYARDRRGADLARDNVATATQAVIDAAMAGGVDPAAADALIGQAVSGLAEFGPPEAFTVGSVEFPANPRRPGLITAAEIEAASETASERVAVAIGEGAVMAADVITPMIREIEEGKSPFDGSVAEQVVARAGVEVRRRNMARRQEVEFARARADLFSGRPIPDSFELPASAMDPVTARSVAAGRRAFAIMLDMDAIPIPEQGGELQERMGALTVADDAEAVMSLVDYLARIKAAAMNGALIDDHAFAVDGIEAPQDEFARGRMGWANSAMSLIAKVLEARPRTVEDAERLAVQAAELLAAGQRHAREAGVNNLTEQRALAIVGEELGRRERSGAVSVARQVGYDVPPLSMTGENGDPLPLDQVASALVERSNLMADARMRIGLQTGADLTAAEAVDLTMALTAAPLAERVAFFEAMAEVPLNFRQRLVAGLRDTAPVIAAAFTAAAINPTAAARAIDDAPVPAGFDRSLVEDMAGAEAADFAADIDRIGIPDAGMIAVTQVAPEVITSAMRDGISPEDIDAELTPAQARRLAAGVRHPFEAQEPDAADMTADRIASDPMARRLAQAARYVPDSPQAVAAMGEMIDRMEAMPQAEREAFIASVANERRAQEIAKMRLPLFYSGDAVTADGLREAAGRIARAYRAGTITREVYGQQAQLIQSLAMEVGTDG